LRKGAQKERYLFLLFGVFEGGSSKGKRILLFGVNEGAAQKEKK
jgi:hypothetical protein